MEGGSSTPDPQLDPFGARTLIEDAWVPSPGNKNHGVLRSLNLYIGASTPQPDSPTDNSQMDQRDRTVG